MRAPNALTSGSILSAFAFTALVALLHCGGDAQNAASGDDAGADAPPPPPDSSSGDDGGREADLRTEAAGTRFRPLYAETTFDDDAIERTFSGDFFDSELRLVCNVREAGGGTYACLPTSGAEAAFSDEGCSTPVVTITHLPRAKENGYVDFGSPCEPKIAKVTGPRHGIVYWKTPDGACFPSELEEVYIPNPQVQPISMFGAFTREEDTASLPGERGGTRLAVERSRFRGADGSFQVNRPRVVDRERGATGEIYRATDAKLRFFTTAGSVERSSEFIDQACTETAFEVSVGGDSSCQQDPRAPKDLRMHRRMDSGCSTFALIKQITEAPVTTTYASLDTTCEARAPSPASKVYRGTAVEELLPTTLVEITEKLVPTLGPSTKGSKIEFRATSHSSADGLELVSRSPLPYLSGLDVACDLMPTGEDGEYRCVPQVPWANHRYYADAACSQPLLSVEVDPCQPAPSALYHDAAKQNGIYRRPSTEPLTLETVYYRDDTNACIADREAMRTSAFYPDSAYEEVPLAEFPKVTKRVVK